MSPRAQQFIKLQERVNAQIDKHGLADSKLVDELDQLSDNLTNNEINEVCDHYNPPIEVDWDEDDQNEMGW